MADGRLRRRAVYKRHFSWDPSQPAPISVYQMKRGILDHIQQFETGFLDKLKSLHDTFQSEIQTLKNFYKEDSHKKIESKSKAQNIRDASSEARVVPPPDIRGTNPKNEFYDIRISDDICLCQESSDTPEEDPVFGDHSEFRWCNERTCSDSVREDWSASDQQKSCLKIRSKSDSQATQDYFEEEAGQKQDKSIYEMKKTKLKHGKLTYDLNTNQTSEQDKKVNGLHSTAQHIRPSKSANSSKLNIIPRHDSVENEADNQLKNLSNNLEDDPIYDNNSSTFPRRLLLTTQNECEEDELHGTEENSALPSSEPTVRSSSFQRVSKLTKDNNCSKENSDRDPQSATDVHNHFLDSETHGKEPYTSPERFSGNCSSTTSCKRPISFKHPHSNFGDRSILSNPQQPPVRSSSLQTRVKGVVEDKRRIHSSYNARFDVEFDERECLANALQYHVTDLVDGLVFADSELPDWLLTEDCVTEDECMTLRKQRNRKDQIRLLIALMKVRDLRVLKTFLGHVERQNEHVANKIKEKFENNKREGMKARLCAYCNLKKQVNVKYVADHLWSVQAIEDNLYYKIINTDRAVGDQNTLWREVTQSFGLQDQRRCKIAHELLLRALDEKKGYSHHIEGLQTMLINNHDRLTCSCEPKIRLAYADSIRETTSSESYIPDSNSEDCDDKSTVSIATTCRELSGPV